MNCNRTRLDFRSLPQLLDANGNCTRCERSFDDHAETPESVAASNAAAVVPTSEEPNKVKYGGDEHVLPNFARISINRSGEQELRRNLKQFFFEISSNNTRADAIVTCTSSSNWLKLRDEWRPILFDSPKGLDINQPLLCTQQFKEILHTLIVWEDARHGCCVDSLFILAGPSGIGKSHISYLLALALYSKGDPVLYVPDAGVLMEDANKPYLLLIMINSFLKCNADILTEEMSEGIKRCTYWMDFMQYLHELHAVVIIDEHGHAYNHIKDEKEQVLNVFPMLLPKFYQQYADIRAVFSGSDQAQFEYQLNGTYTQCIRFVTPFCDSDMTEFLSVGFHKFTKQEYSRYSNNVAREVLKLDMSATIQQYVEERKLDFIRKVSQVAESLSEHGKGVLVQMLDDLFGLCSIGHGTSFISFLDIGLVYRYKQPGCCSKAFPLCYPALLALLFIWDSCKDSPSKRLAHVLSDGLGFEQLVWDALLIRFVGLKSKLPWKQLGANKPKEYLDMSIDAYYVSNASPADMKTDINLWKKYSEDNRANVLYKCPKGTTTLDFCIFLWEHGTIAVQVSLSSLTSHSKPDYEMLNNIGIWRYVYITTSPEEHINIAKGNANTSNVWKAITVEKMRMVDAKDWIGL